MFSLEAEASVSLCDGAKKMTTSADLDPSHASGQKRLLLGLQLDSDQDHDPHLGPWPLQ